MNVVIGIAIGTACIGAGAAAGPVGTVGAGRAAAELGLLVVVKFVA